MLLILFISNVAQPPLYQRLKILVFLYILKPDFENVSRRKNICCVISVVIVNL